MQFFLLETCISGAKSWKYQYNVKYNNTENIL